MNKKVLVVGFFDMFHSGHVEFFRIASQYGELYVSVATDENSIINKNKKPIYNEEERKYMVESCKFVKEAHISYGRTDIFSFEPHLNLIKPDFFIINEDGHDIRKQKICENKGIKYIVLKRNPYLNLPNRSSTSLREYDQIPLRLDFVSFFDQRLLNNQLPGKVVVANINGFEVEERSGMSTSTRKTIKKIFGNKLPTHIEKNELAKIIFTLENIHNTRYISGAVDQIGICYKGITLMEFDKDFWPHSITQYLDNDCIDWLNNYLYITHIKKRTEEFVLYNGDEIISLNVLQKQNELADECLLHIKNKNIIKFGQVINQVHMNQKQIWPNYECVCCKPIIEKYQQSHYGCKLMGAGGCGYAMVVTDKPEANFIKTTITK
jgi:cytidyltransferase-like protein